MKKADFITFIMEPLYKNITNSYRETNEILKRNTKKLEFEAAYIKEIEVNF